MNNQTPFGFFPNNPNGAAFPNPSHQQCHCTNEIGNVSNRINTLEKQINRLERRIRRLELNTMTPTPYANNPTGTDFTNTYDSENYII